jgi:hypothetical protein
MKYLIATSALALLVGMGAARADQVVIHQRFDLDHIDQKVENEVDVLNDVTGTTLEGTNVQNLIQWRDTSPDLYRYRGDHYHFGQYTDEEQEILNEISSRYGDIKATLTATNLQNVLNLEDRLGGSTGRGEKIDVHQILGDTWQSAVNEIEADDEVLAGTKAEITNLANVASIVDQYGAGGRDIVVDLDQKAYEARQSAENKVEAHRVGGTTLSALNGMNIASFDLTGQNGRASIDVFQKTMDVTQTISNKVEAGSVVGTTLSGTNLGNVVTVAVEATN